MKPVFYLCECGCKVPPKRIKTIDKKIQGKRYRILSCPEHDNLLDGQVVEFVFKCKVCGEYFSSNANSFYCDDCKDKANASYNQKTKKEKKNAKIVDGKKKSMDCPLFGNGNSCGQICVADSFDCRVYDNI